MTVALDRALKLAERWKIIRLYNVDGGVCTCKEGLRCKGPGKHPVDNGWQSGAWTDDPHEIERMWAHGNWNVGIPTGRVNGIVVVDIDPKWGGEKTWEKYVKEELNGVEPDTLQVRTGSGGRHFYFEYPDKYDKKKFGNSTPWKGGGIDIRADGGQIVAPTMQHFSGAWYQYINEDAEPTQMPTKMLEFIVKPKRGKTRTEIGTSLSELADAYAGVSFSGLPSVEQLLKIGLPDGAGDDTLFRVLCRERSYLIMDPEGPEDSQDESGEMFTRLLELGRAINDACADPMDDGRVIQKVRSALKQPREDLVVGGGEIDKRPMTDLGNALRIGDAFENEIRYVSGWGWVKWDGQIWRKDQSEGKDHESIVIQTAAQEIVMSGILREAARAEGDLKDQLIKWHKISQGHGKINAMAQRAQYDARLRRSIDHFNREPHLLPVKNGVVDLRTKKLLPFDRDLYPFTSQVEVDYDPNATDDRFSSYVRDATRRPGTAVGCQEHLEFASYLRRAVGYTLTGESSEEVFFLMHGEPAAGKSTLIDVMVGFLGGSLSHVATTPLITMPFRGGEASGDEIAKLAGKRLAVLEDMPVESRLRDDLVRSMTSGGLITGRTIWKSGFTFRSQVKLWIGTNVLPHSIDAGIWRRVKVLPFENPQRDPDRTLKNHVKKNKSAQMAALRWAVDGAYEWYQHGLGTCERVEAAVSEYKRDEDRIQQFIDEECVVGPNYSARISDIHKAFIAWQEKREERKWTIKAFSPALMQKKIDLGLELVKRVRIEGRQVTVVYGIALISDVTHKWSANGTPLTSISGGV